MLTRYQKKRDAIIFMSNIPEEIYHEILVRVPAKSTFVCKCVSKTWLAVISKPDFVKLHLDFAIQRNKCKLMFRSLNYMKDCYQLYSISYDLLTPSTMRNYDDRKDDLAVMDFELPSDFELYGSCNGILCIWNYQNNCFGFWNPATMEYKDASQSPNGYMYIGHDVYAFGYDSENDDYKLVNMIDPEGVCKDEDCDGVKDGRWFVEVYTLGTDTWKNIEPIPYVFYRKAVSGVLVNGALHWWGDKRVKGHSDSTVIVSLDVSDERFGEIQLPEESLGAECYIVSLGALEGCLCVFVDVDEMFNVWVMQEYGVQESWTMRYIIDYREFTSPYDIVRLMWSFEDGEMLLQIHDSDDLVLYDPVNETARKPNIRGLVMSGEENYVESLVSLNTGTYMGKRGRLIQESLKKKNNKKKKKKKQSV